MLTKCGAFAIKNRSFQFFILQLLTTDVKLFTEQLTDLLSMQKFKQKMLILLDLQKIAPEAVIAFSSFKKILSANKLCLVGIIGGSAQQEAMATKLGLHILPIYDNINTQVKIKNEQLIKYVPAELITTTVRSGQKIYARNSDLICMAAVNHGAEIIADGNIHIYGKLSGRALAGASGNQKASIFCTNFDAELVSIAGFYDMNLCVTPNGAPTHIQLVNEKLQIAKIIC